MRGRVHVVGCVALVAAGCSVLRPTVDKAQYFVLTSDDVNPAQGPVQVVLGIERIELPEYLVRSEIVTRTESNQLKIGDNDRWGEPLKDGFARTLRHDLENRLGTGHVVVTPFDPTHRPALLLDVEVRRFERVLPEGVVLEATWTLRDGSGAVLVTKPARVRESVASSDTRATVAALSQALAALATQIADAVRSQR